MASLIRDEARFDRAKFYRTLTTFPEKDFILMSCL
jgi:hypothetical protein